jgi:hypothetical protein
MRGSSPRMTTITSCDSEPPKFAIVLAAAGDLVGNLLLCLDFIADAGKLMQSKNIR